jgi:hypothetical protein
MAMHYERHFQIFLDFIDNDSLGQVSCRHAIIADQSRQGARDEDCIKLSRLVSAAVDFPKTGIPVSIQQAPYIDSNIKPDFMVQLPLSERDFVPGPPSRALSPSPNQHGIRYNQSYYYKSEKVLGKMYRAVDVDHLLKTWNANSGWNEDDPEQL